MKSRHRQSVGRMGESFALAYLEQQGHTTIYRNLRTPYGEIDLSALSKDEISFTNKSEFDLAKKFVGGLVFFASAFPLRLNFLGLVPLFLALMKVWQVELKERKIILFAFYAVVLIMVISSLDGHHDRHLLPIQGFLIVSMLIGLVRANSERNV